MNTMKFTAFGILIIFSATFVLEVDSCSCFRDYAQNSFCHYGNAFKFVVKSVKYFNHLEEEIEKPTDTYDMSYQSAMQQYVIKVVKVYKGNLTVGSELKANSNMAKNLCGVDLEPRTTYITIVPTPVVDGSFLIGLCDYLAIPKLLNPADRKIIRKNFSYRFAKTCGRCSISYEHIEATKGCYANFANSLIDSSRRICSPTKEGHCRDSL